MITARLQRLAIWMLTGSMVGVITEVDTLPANRISHVTRVGIQIVLPIQCYLRGCVLLNLPAPRTRQS